MGFGVIGVLLWFGVSVVCVFLIDVMVCCGFWMCWIFRKFKRVNMVVIMIIMVNMSKKVI